MFPVSYGQTYISYLRWIMSRIVIVVDLLNVRYDILDGGMTHHETSTYM
jgi:hypothetical protein